MSVFSEVRVFRVDTIPVEQATSQLLKISFINLRIPTVKGRKKSPSLWKLAERQHFILGYISLSSDFSVLELTARPAQ